MFASETDNDYTSVVPEFFTSSNLVWTDTSSDNHQPFNTNHKKWQICTLFSIRIQAIYLMQFNCISSQNII